MQAGRRSAQAHLHPPECSGKVLSEAHSVRSHLLIKPFHQSLQGEYQVFVLYLPWQEISHGSHEEVSATRASANAAGRYDKSDGGQA